MMYATKIKMCTGCESSNHCKDIYSIYIEGADDERFYLKGVLHDHLKKTPNSIRVKRGVQPYLVPEESSKGEKYVRSEPNDTPYDNLLALPRE